MIATMRTPPTRRSALPPVREMERALRSRDGSYDGIFLIGVRTTGIFCRPSCPAKKPLAKNMEFYGSIQEAMVAGYRPCKRCRPLALAGEPPEWVRRLLQEAESAADRRLRDRDLARLGVAPERARRFFLKHYGITFHAYCRSLRLGRALRSLREGTMLDDVVFDHGYESHSGFRDAFARTFGQAPGKSRQSDCVVATWIESPLGALIAAATSKGICLLEFSDRRKLPTQLEVMRGKFGQTVVPGTNQHLDRLKDELREYFAGTRRDFTVALEIAGTPFEERVWRALLEIPYGETRSYEGLAESIGAAGGQRAVGTANGRNRIAIVIPCHRVVNKSGKLGGYGGGLWRKQYMLDLEQGKRSLL